MYAPKRERANGGMIKIPVINPAYLKAVMEKPGTKRVERYKVKTLETQRKVPKVIKLKGKSKRLIKGFTKESTSVSTTAPKSKVFISPP